MIDLDQLRIILRDQESNAIPESCLDVVPT